MELKKGSVVISLRGRDKDLTMCVTDIKENGVYVCDGKERKLANPKLKNPKHIKILNRSVSEYDMHSDKALRKALK